MGIDHPALERRHERRTHELHEAGEHDEIGRVLGDGSVQRRVPLSAFIEIADPQDKRRDADGFGTLDRVRAPPVGTDRHHPGAVRRPGTGIEQGLQVCAFA